MSTFSDYSFITKLDKSHYNTIKRDIYLISQKLSSTHPTQLGTTGPVPYDTAWVARVPKTDLSSPAFPECLQWLRLNQKEDGGWGAGQPYSLHSNILNTFSATLALFEWNYTIDEDRRQRAIGALTVLAETLPQIETKDKMFEMIMCGLIDDAVELELDIPYDNLEWCYKIGEKELEKIEEGMLNGSSKYWALLEATDRKLDLKIKNFRPEITQHGLIAGQPSSTAYLLRYARLKGADLQEVEWSLKGLSAQNDGGVPHLSLCDNFKIIFGLDFLFKVGINPKINVKHLATKKALDTLKKRLKSNSIGFSSKARMIGDECLMTALRVIQQGSTENGEKSEDKMVAEPQFDEDSDFLKKLTSFKVANNNADKLYLAGRRNLSVYYDILQKMSDYQHQSMTEIIQFIGRRQNDDGGWGDETSTIEETAYVCLTIYRLVQINAQVLDFIDIFKVSEFINGVKVPRNECFWRYKVNFCSDVLSDTAIACAKYAIFQIQRLCAWTDIFNENQLDYLDCTLYEINDEPVNPGHFLLIARESQKDIGAHHQETVDCFNELFPSQNENIQNIIDASIRCSYYSLPGKISPKDRAIHSFLQAYFTLLDEVFDFYLADKNDLFKQSSDFLDLLCKTLCGECTNSNEESFANFPRHSLILQWSFCYRKVLGEKKWKPSSFVRILKNWIFKGFLLDYELQCNGINPTLKRYLQVHAIDLGLVEVAYGAALLENKNVDISEFESCDLLKKYLNSACKAGRIRTDVSSVQTDLKLCKSDNYCIKLQEEYGVSPREALIRATRKSNKEILKMLCLKKSILQDPKFQQNKNVNIFMKCVENFVEACLLWSLETPRYNVGNKMSFSRIVHAKKDVSFNRGLCFD